MKYQAIVTVSFDAEDVYAERNHRQALAAKLDLLKTEYPDASLTIKVRRPRVKPRASAPAKLGEGVEIIRARYVA